MSIKCPHCSGLISIKVETIYKKPFKGVPDSIIASKNTLAFIDHVKVNFTEQKLTISELVKIYSEFIVGSNISPIRLGTLLAESGEFPRSKVTYQKGAKAVRLYHIR